MASGDLVPALVTLKVRIGTAFDPEQQSQSMHKQARKPHFYRLPPQHGQQVKILLKTRVSRYLESEPQSRFRCAQGLC